MRFTRGTYRLADGCRCPILADCGLAFCSLLLQVPTGKGRVINCLLAKAGEQSDFSPVCLNVLSWLARRRLEDWRTGEFVRLPWLLDFQTG